MTFDRFAPLHLVGLPDDGAVAAPGESRAEHPQDGPLRVQSLDLVATTRPGDDVSAGEDGCSVPSSPANLYSVEAHDVELGDLLLDWPYARVAHIWFNGVWLYFDSDMVRIASVRLGDTVQVVRVAALTGDCSIDCLERCAYPGQFSECDIDNKVSPQAIQSPAAVDAGEVEQSSPPSSAMDWASPHGLERPRARLIRGAL